MSSLHNNMDNNMDTILTRRRFLTKMLAPILLCVVGATFYIAWGTGGVSKLDGRVFNPERNLAPGRRSLALAPYDQTTTSLPAWTNTFANVWDPMLPTDTPTFWYETKGGGTTVTYLFAYCLGLVIANHQGQYTDNSTLGVWQVGAAGIFPNARRYVNTRTHTPGWLDIAKSRGLLQSGLADVIFTPYVTYAGENFFQSGYRARGFAMMRHPAKRVEDQFFYRQHATWETNYDVELATMSLAEFATSNKLVENFEVRQLLKLDTTTDITEADVNMAKAILRQKFVVGIFEWFDVSIVRLEKYFGWWTEYDVLDNYTINWCHFKMIDSMDHIGSYPKVPTSESIQDTITTRMWADVELYQYAKALFNEQAALLPQA